MSWYAVFQEASGRIVLIARLLGPQRHASADGPALPAPSGGI